MKTTVSKNSVESYALYVWNFLGEILNLKAKELPPIYLFLAPWSKGSLTKRSIQEIRLVHDQQVLGEGITLIHPPAAWVSIVDQIPEEVGHLFAIVHKKKEFSRKPSRKMSLESELAFITLHEAFGYFASALSHGKKLRAKVSDCKRKARYQDDLWPLAHHAGYFLGHRLAENYFSEQVSLKKLRAWFLMDWDRSPQKALKALKKLTK